MEIKALEFEGWNIVTVQQTSSTKRWSLVNLTGEDIIVSCDQLDLPTEEFHTSNNIYPVYQEFEEFVKNNNNLINDPSKDKITIKANKCTVGLCKGRPSFQTVKEKDSKEQVHPVEKLVDLMCKVPLLITITKTMKFCQEAHAYFVKHKGMTNSTHLHMNIINIKGLDGKSNLFCTDSVTYGTCGILPLNKAMAFTQPYMRYPNNIYPGNGYYINHQGQLVTNPVNNYPQAQLQHINNTQQSDQTSLAFIKSILTKDLEPKLVEYIKTYKILPNKSKVGKLTIAKFSEYFLEDMENSDTKLYDHLVFSRRYITTQELNDGLMIAIIVYYIEIHRKNKNKE